MKQRMHPSFLVAFIGVYLGCSTGMANNLLRNSGFEGNVVENLPEFWGTFHWGLRDSLGVIDHDRWKTLWGLDSGKSYEGRHSLKIEIPGDEPHESLRLTSCQVHLPNPGSYTFSAYITADRDDYPVTLTIYDGFANPIMSRQIRVNRQWNRYHLTHPVATEKVLIGFTPESRGTVWIDAVQIEEGTEPTAYQLSPRDSLPTPSTISLRQCTTKPHLDGNLEKPFWERVPSLPLKGYAGATTIKAPTGVKLLCDQENLYVAVHCTNRAGPPDLNIRRPHDHLLWRPPDQQHRGKVDAVEIFLSPNKDGKPYYLFVFDPAGNQYESKSGNANWDAPWTVRTKALTNGWSAEVAIPWSSILADVKKGEPLWRINICRENSLDREYLALFPTYGPFHTLSRFGFLEGVPVSESAHGSSEKKHHALSDRGASNPEPPKTPAPSHAVPVDPHSGLLIVEGKPFFPLSIYWDRPQHLTLEILQAIRALGANSLVVQIPRDRDSMLRLAALAQSAGLKLIVETRLKKADPASLEDLHRVMTTLRESPAVIAWMVMDEPELLQDDYESQSAQIYKAAKGLDPHRPVFINHTSHQKFRRGMPTDIASVDLYPVPDQDPGVIPELVDDMRKAELPIWLFLQTIGNAYFYSREPNADELFRMAISGVVRGATGIHCFENMPHTAGLRESMKTVFKLITEYTSILAVPLQDGILKHRPEGNLVISTRGDHTGRYLLAFNPEEHDHTLEIEVNPNLGIRFIQDLAPNSAPLPADGKVSLLIPGKQLKIFRLTPP